ncbi:glycosyltransferase family 29 protein [Gemmobacter sp. LW-1]|uniref:glycosyltransferase family 29 protein n=1 Tax=Gemmobacter sp. LW-1 TaxID=1529005 RepID=UPI0006C74A19|nr:glycosyltransferase family 29 protein [Gemmobacter sp. LW-1]
MNRLGYLIAKYGRNDAAFQAASIPEGELLAPLVGKRIALVGNARALAQGDYGAEIDAADLVIRINAAPIPSARSHGTRTDWVGLAVRMPAARHRLLGQPRLLWMSPRLHRISWLVASQPGFFRYPRPRYDALRAKLGVGPTTGIMLIDLLADSDLAELRLYGFDFFASLSLSGPRTAADVGHNFAGEADFVADLTKRDPRILHRR